MRFHFYELTDTSLYHPNIWIRQSSKYSRGYCHGDRLGESKRDGGHDPAQGPNQERHLPSNPITNARPDKTAQKLAEREGRDHETCDKGRIALAGTTEILHHEVDIWEDACPCDGLAETEETCPQVSATHYMTRHYRSNVCGVGGEGKTDLAGSIATVYRKTIALAAQP